ncbi:hypothetical protein G6F63_013740 [Rhizopus arrhizus]|nr:hypothetical protein G6F63_013740 [Rhizopus arrhizus]
MGGLEAVGDDVGGAHHAQELPLLVAAGGAVAPQAEATFADDGRPVGLVQQVGAAGRVGQAEVDGTRGTKHAVEFQVRRRCPPAAFVVAAGDGAGHGTGGVAGDDGITGLHQQRRVDHVDALGTGQGGGALGGLIVAVRAVLDDHRAQLVGDAEQLGHDRVGQYGLGLGRIGGMHMGETRRRSVRSHRQARWPGWHFRWHRSRRG